jgi:cytoskeleton protein RodZ
VDAEPLVREYDARLGPSPAGPAARGPRPSATIPPEERRKRAGAIALLIVLVAALAGIVYHAEASRHAGHAAAAGHQPLSAHHAARKHTASSAAHRGARHTVISVTAVSEPCWAELTTRHGATIFEGIIGPGTSRTWTERRAVTLRLGNPGAVRLKVDGKRRTGLGPNPVTLSLAPPR